jgi:hypothetical protein
LKAIGSSVTDLKLSEAANDCSTVSFEYLAACVSVMRCQPVLSTWLSPDLTIKAKILHTRLKNWTRWFFLDKIFFYFQLCDFT